MKRQTEKARGLRSPLAVLVPAAALALAAIRLATATVYRGGIPPTSDDMPLGLICVLLGVSAAALIVLGVVWYRRKKQPPKQKENTPPPAPPQPPADT